MPDPYIESSFKKWLLNKDGLIALKKRPYLERLKIYVNTKFKILDMKELFNENEIDQNELFDILKKQLRRRSQNETIENNTLKDRLYLKKMSHVFNTLNSILKHTEFFYNINFQENENNLKINTELDYDYYGRNCNFPKKLYTFNFKFKNFRSPSKMQYDGIFNISVLNSKMIGNIKLEKMLIIKKGRGYELKLEEVYISSFNEMYYHAKNVKTAMKGIQKKIKKDLKLKNLTLESEITRKDYRDITGACNFGINDFIERNNLKVNKIKISDLLPLLKNEYGYKKLLSCLKT